jgi:hypothetical protein
MSDKKPRVFQQGLKLIKALEKQNPAARQKHIRQIVGILTQADHFIKPDDTEMRGQFLINLINIVTNPDSEPAGILNEHEKKTLGQRISLPMVEQAFLYRMSTTEFTQNKNKKKTMRQMIEDTVSIIEKKKNPLEDYDGRILEVERKKKANRISIILPKGENALRLKVPHKVRGGTQLKLFDN